MRLIIITDRTTTEHVVLHVTIKGYTEVLAKPTNYRVSPVTCNNHSMTLMQGFFSLCHISVTPVRESGRWSNVSTVLGHVTIRQVVEESLLDVW